MNNDWILPAWQVAPFIAKEDDLVKWYGSVDGFKAYVTGELVEIINSATDALLANFQGVPPVVFFPSTDGVHYSINQVFLGEDEINSSKFKGNIPLVLRALILQSVSKQPNHKVIATVALSEAWYTSHILPDTGEATIKRPQNDPQRQEIVVIGADFIFGEAMGVRELLRDPVRLGEVVQTFEFNRYFQVQGRMGGLLRKAAGTYVKPPAPDNINIVD